MTATLTRRKPSLSRRISHPTLKSHLAFTLLSAAAVDGMKKNGIPSPSNIKGKAISQ